MTAAKAAAGGIAGALSDFLTYLLVTWVPGLMQLPEAQQQNLEIIVTGLVVGATVYLTPNRPAS